MTMTSMAMVRWETKLTMMATANKVDNDSDGATGDDNNDDNGGDGDGAMGSGATGYDDDDDGKRQQRP